MPTRFAPLLILALTIAAVSCAPIHPSPENAATGPLRFSQQGRFKILQVADAHYNNGASTTCADILPSQLPCSDLNTTAFIQKVIESEKPDLIVFTGDNIDGGATDAAASMKAIFAPAINTQTPWAAIFGNHDQQSTLNRPEMMRIITSLPFSYSSFGPAYIHGVGNYHLEILDNANNLSHVNIFLLDSGADSLYPSIAGYDWIWPNQVAWFLEANRNLTLKNGNVSLPSLAFFHIPIPEYKEVLLSPIVGNHQEAVSSPGLDSGFFAAALEAGNIVAMSCGHDHVNDYCGTYSGIHLCYSGGVGYHAYGKTGWARRMRVFDLEFFGKSISTYKVLDDGSLTVVDRQTLL